MAREVRLDPRAQNADRLGCMAFMLCVTLIVLASITTERARPGPVVGVGGLGLLAWIVYQLVQSFKRYRCPWCGDHLTERIDVGREASGAREDSGPIHYVCPHCDVEWDSGQVWSTCAD